MTKLILINGLTLSRVPLSLLFCYLLSEYINPLFPCLVIFALVAASDYWDGRLARRYQISSNLGAVFDVATDFFFIVTTCALLMDRGLLPSWMISVIVMKFLEFCLSSAYSRRHIKHKPMFVFDPFGRFVALCFYILPVITLLLQFFLPLETYRLMLLILCLWIAAMAVISTVFRIRAMVNRRAVY